MRPLQMRVCRWHVEICLYLPSICEVLLLLLCCFQDLVLAHDDLLSIQEFLVAEPQSSWILLIGYVSIFPHCVAYRKVAVRHLHVVFVARLFSGTDSRKSRSCRSFQRRGGSHDFVASTVPIPINSIQIRSPQWMAWLDRSH